MKIKKEESIEILKIIGLINNMKNGDWKKKKHKSRN